MNTLIGRWRARRRRLAEEHERRRTLLAFEAIVTASYPRNVGRVLPGEIPVIAPRVSDFR